MLDVRLGDRGPRVVLLQVLLNRRNAALVVDGIFGPKTEDAVREARRRFFGAAGPIADADFWTQLFSEQQLCSVDAFDLGEAGFQTGAGIVGSAGSRVVATGAMCNGVETVVQGIRARTRPPGSLGVLRTWGHGNRGHWLSFTVGEIVHLRQINPALGRAIAQERRSYIDPQNFGEMSSALAPVRQCFARIGIYEHHGCTLGSVPATRHMMGRLAGLWGVPVTVAVGKQFIPRVADEAFRFQGETFTAYPGGSKHAWISRVLAEERTSR